MKNSPKLLAIFVYDFKIATLFRTIAAICRKNGRLSQQTQAKSSKKLVSSQKSP